MAIGILLAAGMGTRMRPLTESTPKPMLKVGDITLIETVIEALQQACVTDIYIVTGYKAEHFTPLTEKYPEVHLIHNPEYETKNNLSSLYVVADKLHDEECFICEADLYIRNKSILESKNQPLSTTPLPASGYFAKYHEGSTDDWCFDTDDTRCITRVGKSGTDTHMMVGLSYFTKKDSTVLSDAVKKSYHTPGTETLFWDDIVNQNLDKLNLTVFPVANDDLYEVDTPEELENLRVALYQTS